MNWLREPATRADVYLIGSLCLCLLASITGDHVVSLLMAVFAIPHWLAAFTKVGAR